MLDVEPDDVLPESSCSKRRGKRQGHDKSRRRHPASSSEIQMSDVESDDIQPKSTCRKRGRRILERQQQCRPVPVSETPMSDDEPDDALPKSFYSKGQGNRCQRHNEPRRRHSAPGSEIQMSDVEYDDIEPKSSCGKRRRRILDDNSELSDEPVSTLQHDADQPAKRRRLNGLLFFY
jgi:hypothetical protein